MSGPDLDTEEGRAAYRAELRKVALPLRWGGLAMIVGAALFIWSLSRGWLGLPQDAAVVGYGMLALGWVLVIASIWMRTRHHRLRMAELDGGAR